MKILSLFDTHVPEHINLKPIMKFAHDFRPDVVVLGGDMHDFDVVSHWIANQSLSLDGKSIQKCYSELRSVVLDPLKTAIPKACKMIYLKGNHEDWLDQAIDLNRNGRGYWELENNIDQVRYNLSFVPVNLGWEPCDNLVYIHGIYTTVYHARATVQAYHKSVIYGHVHDHQVYTQVSPVDSEHFYKATSAGCLCNLNPHYAHNRPSRWIHGFNFCYVNEKTGQFHDTQVIIVRNSFWANGKFYE